jgi:hypothetical protein
MEAVVKACIRDVLDHEQRLREMPAKGVRLNCCLLSLKSENSVHNEEGNFYAKTLGQGLDHL